MRTIADSLVVQRGADDMVLNEHNHHVVTGNDGICPTQLACSPASLQVLLTFPDTEVGDMPLFAKDHRESLLVDDEQDLMMGCARTTPPEQQLFSSVRFCTSIVLQIQILNLAHFYL